MHYNLKVEGVAASDEVRAYLERKLESIDKLLGRREQSIRADVELSYLETEEKQFVAEATLHDGASLRAKASAASLHEAIDMLVNELASEIKKDHEKHRTQVREGGALAKEMLREGEEI